MDRENKILIDWFAFTLHGLTLDEVVRILGLYDCIGSFQEKNGHDGYKDSLLFSGITIFFNGHQGQGIHVRMSGQGCRAFETYSDYHNFDDFIPIILRYPKSKITRLDVACDVFDGVLPINEILQCLINKDWTSSAGARFWESVFSSAGLSGYIGSPQSRVRVRFYDKAAEQNVNYYWVRCELQLRDEQAFSFLERLYCSDETITDVYFGVLNNYVRFISRDHVNVSRSEVKPWWNDFIQHNKKIKLWSPGIEYNIGRLKQNVEERWGSAIQTYLTVFGYISLKESLDKIKPIKELPEQYKRIILDYAADFHRNSQTQEITYSDGTVIELINDLPTKLEKAINELELK